MAEFALVLMVLIVVVFMLINLIGLSCACASVMLIARQSAERAAVSKTFDDARDGMATEAEKISKSGFGRFSKLRPSGGWNNAGVDLYLEVTDVHSSQTTTYGPNSKLPSGVILSSNILECSSRAIFEVTPLISLAGVPFVQDVPGLGKPVPISASWQRDAERPAIFLSSPANNNDSDSSSSSGGGTAQDSSSAAAASELSAWNYPNRGTFAAMPGQVILDQKDSEVFARDAFWKDSGITVEEGNRLAFDFLADGTWGSSVGGQMQYFDADGAPADVVNGAEMPGGALAGKVGNSKVFYVGKDLYNFKPPGTGRLYLIFNDGLTDDGQLTNPSWYTDNDGSQRVRVYLTN